MKINCITHFIKDEATSYTLKDSTVVIDAQNYFYNMYEKSRLPFSFGCESDRFANVLKEHLNNFKKANVKCLFVFKGGSSDLEHNFNKKYYSNDPQNTTVTFLQPTFACNICQQVLDEMNFDYVNCPLEAKDYCITLAKKFRCPVISYDQEFPISKVPYIPYKDMQFDEQNNCFNCVKFNLEVMLRKYGLSEEKFILFLVLTDTDCFPENYFVHFLRSNRIPLNNYYRIVNLLKWLSRLTREQALVNIFKYLNNDDQNKFTLMIEKTYSYLKEKREGIPSHLFLYGDRTRISRNDPKWFEKGVMNKFISKPYINLYYSNVYMYKKTINFQENKNEYLLSTDIIIYAYNLLTNYTKDEFSLKYTSGDIVTYVDTRKLPFPKPIYEADTSVFENGWDEIKNLGLLEHFLNGTMNGIELKYLEELPDDAKLLIISLAYYTVKSSNETLDELYSILLSYVMLGIVFDERVDVNITKTDYKKAIDVTKDYFELNEAEIECINDSELIYPLTEFQHCLEEMNNLNALCGYPYKPTIYSKTYNGTFVYKILHSLKTKDLDREDFLVNTLGLPTTVYEYLQNLSVIHERLIMFIED